MFGLTFLSPWFLLGLAAAAGPLLLHLFAREHAVTTTLPTARFVPRTVVQQTRRRRLQDLWLLLLRMLAVTVLALVFARPFVASSAASAEPAMGIVAVDTSFSMAGDGRDEAARRMAREAVAGFESGARIALMSFAREPRLLVAPTLDRGALDAAIGQITPGFGATDYAAVLRGALETANRHPARLVIISDGQRAGADAQALPALPRELEVAMRTVTPIRQNLSIDAVRRVNGDVIAVVRNHAAEERRTRVTWTIDGAAASSNTLTLAAGAALETAMGRTAPSRGVIVASIEDPGGLSADDRRYLVADPPKPTPVFVVVSVDGSNESGLYVRAALDAAGVDKAPFEVSVVRANDARLEDSRTLSTLQALIIVGTRGLTHAARVAIAHAIESGRGALVAAGPDVEPGVVRELLGGSRELSEPSLLDTGVRGLVAVDLRHPVLAALGDAVGNLGQIRVERSWAVRDMGAGTTILRLSSGQPALSELHLGKGRLLLLTTDLGRRWNTWPLHPTFVPFLVEAVKHLGNDRGVVRDVLVGDLLEPETSRPGVVTLPSTGDRVAVNVDSRESRIETIAGDEFTAGLERVGPTISRAQVELETEQGQNLWRYGVFALLLLLCVEGFAAARRGAVRTVPMPESAAEHPSGGTSS